MQAMLSVLQQQWICITPCSCDLDHDLTGKICAMHLGYTAQQQLMQRDYAAHVCVTGWVNGHKRLFSTQSNTNQHWPRPCIAMSRPVLECRQCTYQLTHCRNGVQQGYPVWRVGASSVLVLSNWLTQMWNRSYVWCMCAGCGHQQGYSNLQDGWRMAPCCAELYWAELRCACCATVCSPPCHDQSSPL